MSNQSTAVQSACDGHDGGGQGGNPNTTAVQMAGGLRNKATRPLLQGAGIPMALTWNQSVPLWEYHRDGECTHYCFPSVPNLSTFALYRTLIMHSEQLAAHIASAVDGPVTNARPLLTELPTFIAGDNR